jgi:hypothetical protein
LDHHYVIILLHPYQLRIIDIFDWPYFYKDRWLDYLSKKTEIDDFRKIFDINQLLKWRPDTSILSREIDLMKKQKKIELT